MLFRRFYYPPESHPWISAEERAYILADREPRRAAADDVAGTGPVPSQRLLGLRQTWGIILGKALTDPVWFFITDWFAIYLVARGFALEDEPARGSGCRSWPRTPATSSAAASPAT